MNQTDRFTLVLKTAACSKRYALRIMNHIREIDRLSSIAFKHTERADERIKLFFVVQALLLAALGALWEKSLIYIGILGLMGNILTSILTFHALGPIRKIREISDYFYGQEEKGVVSLSESFFLPDYGMDSRSHLIIHCQGVFLIFWVCLFPLRAYA